MRIAPHVLPCFCAIAGATILLALAGCKSSGTNAQIPPTPSGMPEVTLPAKTADEIKAVAREFFRSRGYVETDSRHMYEMVFDKPIEGDRKGKALRVKLRLNRELDGSWRLIGTPMGVESWRGDLETERMLPQGASQIQAFLAEIKGRIESGR